MCAQPAPSKGRIRKRNECEGGLQAEPRRYARQSSGLNIRSRGETPRSRVRIKADAMPKILRGGGVSRLYKKNKATATRGAPAAVGIAPAALGLTQSLARQRGEGFVVRG